MLNQHQTVKDCIAKYNKDNLLADYLVPFIGKKGIVDILDVGSGPYSTIGNYLPWAKVNITLCDNQDFSSFWEKYNIDPHLVVWLQDMENLSFRNNTFDIVHCANALDHTKDAKKAVEEMIRVCKAEGWVYIECHLDQKDTGHKHYWNAKEDGSLTNGEDTFNLKDFGFEIEYIDNGGERRYNKIIAKLQKR